MKDPKMISTSPPSIKSMDYDFLRIEGIRIAQELSGDIWTDFNYHDPGVTMLEQLCYAITDLGHRTNLPIKDLLQIHTDDYDIRKQNVLYPPSSILTCNPITVTDFRKLIIDGIPQVINAWLEPIKDHPLGIKGLYRVHVQLDEDIEADDIKNDVSNKVRKIFNKNRNLCEDIEGVYILNADLISIAASIEIGSEEIGERILAKILLNLEQYVNPYIQIYSVEQLFAEDKKINEIFDGPLPLHGFIKTSDLKPMNREIYTSQISEIILRMTGVRSVNYLEVRRNGIKVYDDVLNFEDGNYPLMIADMQLPSDKGYPIQFTKNGVPYRLDTNLALQIYEMQKANEQKEYKVKLKLDEELPKANSSKSEIRDYYSIQREFPGVYGIDEKGLPAKADRKRQAQAQQLKAYLLFFEQHMANHLAQLANIKHLFSIDEDLEQTYFSQVPESIPHLFGREHKSSKNIFSDEDKNFVKKFKTSFYEILRGFNIKGNGRLHLINYLLKKCSIDYSLRESSIDYNLLSSEELHYDLEIYIEELSDDIENLSDDNKELIKSMLTSFKADRLSLVDSKNADSFLEELNFLGKKVYDKNEERRNRALDHLLARFGEHFYTDLLMQFNILDSNEHDVDSIGESAQAKVNFLKNYEKLSQDRGNGYDYLEPSMKTENVSGLKKRICLLLNITDYSERKLTTLIKDFELYQRKSNNVDITEKVMKIDEKQTRTVAALSSKNYRSNRFIFHSTSKDILGELLTFGTNSANYEMQMKSDGSAMEVSFAKPGHQRRVKIYEGFDEEECDEMIEKLIDKLNAINQVSEGFYLIEHILLRPLHQTLYKYNVFGVKGNPVIESYQPGSWENQKYITDDLILSGTNTNNYSIVLNEDYTYDVVLYDEIHQPIGRVVMEDNSVLETRADAMDYIDSVVAYLDKFKRGQGNISSIIEIVQEKSRFEVDIDTFFSQRCTIILPNWSARFNNKDFRSLLEMVVAENAPLHINIDFIWLDIYKMQQFEKAYEEWLNEKQNPEPEQPLLDDLAIQLTHLMKDFKEEIDD